MPIVCTAFADLLQLKSQSKSQSHGRIFESGIAPMDSLQALIKGYGNDVQACGIRKSVGVGIGAGMGAGALKPLGLTESLSWIEQT